MTVLAIFSLASRINTTFTMSNSQDTQLQPGTASRLNTNSLASKLTQVSTLCSTSVRPMMFCVLLETLVVYRQVWFCSLKYWSQRTPSSMLGHFCFTSFSKLHQMSSEYNAILLSRVFPTSLEKK